MTRPLPPPFPSFPPFQPSSLFPRNLAWKADKGSKSVLSESRVVPVLMAAAMAVAARTLQVLTTPHSSVRSPHFSSPRPTSHSSSLLITSPHFSSLLPLHPTLQDTPSGAAVEPGREEPTLKVIPSPHLASPHLTSPHLTSPHLTSPHTNTPDISPFSTPGDYIHHLALLPEINLYNVSGFQIAFAR